MATTWPWLEGGPSALHGPPPPPPPRPAPAGEEKAGTRPPVSGWPRSRALLGPVRRREGEAMAVCV
eukprot:scaffold16099_cov117-Isochrysis_galbana.AAC.1